MRSPSSGLVCLIMLHMINRSLTYSAIKFCPNSESLSTVLCVLNTFKSCQVFIALASNFDSGKFTISFNSRLPVIYFGSCKCSLNFYPIRFEHFVSRITKLWIFSNFVVRQSRIYKFVVLISFAVCISWWKHIFDYIPLYYIDQ